MAIIKKNTYIPGINNDLNNVLVNVDLGRISIDRTNIAYVSYSSPNVTYKILAGSEIEVNGDLYQITTDETVVFAEANKYLLFDGTTFSGSLTKGTYDATKGGFYTDATHRVLRWRIDSPLDFFLDLDVMMNSSDSTVNKDGLYVSGDLQVTGSIRPTKGIWAQNYQITGNDTTARNNLRTLLKANYTLANRTNRIMLPGSMYYNTGEPYSFSIITSALIPSGSDENIILYSFSINNNVFDNVNLLTTSKSVWTFNLSLPAGI